MPGGNTRTTSFHPPYPVVIERSEGPWMWDVDECRYLDLFCNGLSLIHGHGYAPVREAIVAALERGMAWSGASREQIAYAEMLRDRLPAMEQLRFTNSGSEAGMLAVKAARHLTGRPYILKAVGAYHGCLSRSGSGSLRPGQSARPRARCQLQRPDELRAGHGRARHGGRGAGDRAGAGDGPCGGAGARILEAARAFGAALRGSHDPG